MRTFGVGYLGLPGSYASSCVLSVYVAGYSGGPAQV